MLTKYKPIDAKIAHSLPKYCEILLFNVLNHASCGPNPIPGAKCVGSIGLGAYSKLNAHSLKAQGWYTKITGIKIKTLGVDSNNVIIYYKLLLFSNSFGWVVMGLS